MRDILFRGKRVDNGEWVEGSLLGSDVIVPKGQRLSVLVLDMSIIDGATAYPVIPETVSEYAGCEDIHGNKIFENHIVKRIAFGKEYYRKVVFQDGAFGTVMTQDGEEYFTPFATRCMCEVMGNVFDNPELLEGDAQ